MPLKALLLLLAVCFALDQIDYISYGSKPRATFLVLCRNNELYELLETLQSVEDRFNWNYHYDYVFLNDDPFEETFIKSVSKFLPDSKVSFGQVPTEHWSYPEWVDLDKAEAMRQQMKDNVVYGDSESYRHMCRFFSGFFSEHELLAPYDYYWRIEPGIKLLCDVNYDIFEEMDLNDRKYAFTLTMFEYTATIATLWDHVKKFRETHSINGELLPLIENDDAEKSFNLCHFWSNFEIARVDIWRSQEYREFFEYLDKTGGFFYERWGDAPIHSIFVALYLNKSDIIHLDDFGYFHDPYLQCPMGEDLRLKNRCVCDPGQDFSYSYQSCTAHFRKVIE